MISKEALFQNAVRLASDGRELFYGVTNRKRAGASVAAFSRVNGGDEGGIMLVKAAARNPVGVAVEDELWELPGGGISNFHTFIVALSNSIESVPDEEFKRTALKEFEQETGIDTDHLKDFSKLGDSECDKGNGRDLNRVFSGLLDPIVIPTQFSSHEIIEIGLFNHDDASGKKLHHAARFALEHAQAMSLFEMAADL